CASCTSLPLPVSPSPPPPASPTLPHTTLFRSKRPNLPPEDFRRLADAFDVRVTEFRDSQDRKARAIARIHDAERQAFFQAGLPRSEEHTSELQSRENLVCRLLLEKKKLEQTST